MTTSWSTVRHHGYAAQLFSFCSSNNQTFQLSCILQTFKLTVKCSIKKKKVIVISLQPIQFCMNGAFLMIFQLSKTLWTGEIQRFFGHEAELPSPAFFPVGESWSRGCDRRSWVLITGVGTRVGLLWWEGVSPLRRVMIPATRANSWWLHRWLVPVIFSETRGADENAVCLPLPLLAPSAWGSPTTTIKHPITVRMVCHLCHSSWGAKGKRGEGGKKSKTHPTKYVSTKHVALENEPSGGFLVPSSGRDDEEVGWKKKYLKNHCGRVAVWRTNSPV